MKPKKPKTTEIPMKKNETPVTLVGEADKIWQEIKNVDLGLFTLPGQTVEKHCVPQFVEPSKLYLLIQTGAAVAALEEVFKKVYVIEQAGKYITVARKTEESKQPAPFVIITTPKV